VVLATRLPADFLHEGRTLVDYREGLASNLAVIEDQGRRLLEIDRWWQGEDRVNHQAVAAHLPMLLHHDPRRVLVVGAGTGQTPSRFLLYDVESVEVVDIEPAVFDVIRDHFASAWMDDSRVRLLRQDGRNHVVHTDRTYDVISLEVGQTFRPGVAFFYTEEFYARARERLTAGGLLVQFVPMPFLEPEQLKSVVATFLRVFPESTLWYNTAELLLIGAEAGRFAIDPGRLSLLRTDAAIHRDLAYAHWGGPARRLHHPSVLLASLLMGPDGLAALAGDAPAYHDDRPVLDYATGGIDLSETREIGGAALLRPHLEPVDRVLGLRLPDGGLERIEAVRARNLDDLRARALVRKAGLLAGSASREELAALTARALEANPENASARRMWADTLMQQGRFEEARSTFAAALALDADDPLSHRGHGVALSQLGRHAEAVRSFRAALDRWPDDVATHNNLGVTLVRLGDRTGALRHFEEAARLRPGFADAERNLERLRLELGGRAPGG